MVDPPDEPGIVGSLHHESGVVFPELFLSGELALLASSSFFGRPVCAVASLLGHCHLSVRTIGMPGLVGAMLPASVRRRCCRVDALAADATADGALIMRGSQFGAQFRQVQPQCGRCLHIMDQDREI